MRRVLVLTASYGSGHNEAARSLAAAFAARGVATRVVDHFETMVHPLFARASRLLYHAVLRGAPALWGAAYAAGDALASDSPLALGMTRLGTARLAEALRRDRPDGVVTVHATPAAAMSALVARGEQVPPHVTVVTDFVAHRQWIAPHVDHYCVAAEEVRHDFVARGIPGQRVTVTGVPVREEFERPVDGLAARRALGLSSRRPVVLAMAGSHGAFGRLPAVAQALRGPRLPVQGVLVAGRSEPLRRRLERLAAGSSLRVLGYVDDVRRWMAAADLVVSKAGGMTLAEALAAEVPLLAFGSLPGQERRNERFASQAGVALVARSRRELAAHLEHALADPELLEALRDRIARVRRPGAAARIVDLVLQAPALVP